jgi:TAG lipase/steryl ester hydrolase/phospholipase A2/LPA acyltransferase
VIITMSKALKRKMAEAETYEEWQSAAQGFDERNGLGRWKLSEKTRSYDYATIRRRLDALKSMRKLSDNHAILFTLNEGIHGNLGGMGSSSLYNRAKFGTKQLIVDYVEEVSSALEYLAKPKLKGVSMREKIDFFNRAHLCFGQSALMFSGSGTFLFFHVGVLKALWEQNLIPDVISGSSGGALIAAVAGSRKSEQLGEIFKPEFLEFENEIKNIIRNLAPGKKRYLRKNDLMKIIERIIPDITFEEAYQISGLKINISIAPYERHQKSRLLNAITSPNVMLREAVLASCCIPGVFPPVSLAARNVKGNRVPYLPQRKWVDGSMSDDLPMKRLSRLYGVNHFIVSQTNPLVLPFLKAENRNSGLVSTVSNTALKTMKDWGLAASHLMQRPFKENSYASKLINGYIALVSQTYTGDINILPSSRFLSPAQVLASRSSEEVMELLNEGERATWPAIERIRIQTRISRTLNRLLDDLDRAVVSGGRRAAHPKRKVVKSLTLVETKTETETKAAAKAKSN